MNYWRSADGRDRRLLHIADGHLTAIDAKTGQTVSTFGRNGQVDRRTGSFVRCPATVKQERTRGRKARAPATAASTTGR